MSKSLQLRITKEEIQKYLLDQDGVKSDLIIEALLDEDSVFVDVWREDGDEEKSLRSRRLSLSMNNKQNVFMWCIFLGILTYVTNRFLMTPSPWY